MLRRKHIFIFNLVGFEEGFSRCLDIAKNSFVASRRLAQRDRWILTLYQKHFDLSKTRSATTDYVTWNGTVNVCNRIDQGGPRLQAWRAALRFEEKFAGRKRRNSIVDKRLVCCSNRPNFCCAPNAIFDSRVIFKFSVCLRLKIDIFC